MYKLYQVLEIGNSCNSAVMSFSRGLIPRIRAKEAVTMSSNLAFILSKSLTNATYQLLHFYWGLEYCNTRHFLKLLNTFDLLNMLLVQLLSIDLLIRNCWALLLLKILATISSSCRLAVKILFSLSKLVTIRNRLLYKKNIPC